MYETLIKLYSDKMSELTQKEIRKASIELDSLDLSSKETMIKLCTQLQQQNIEYKGLCDDVVALKSECTVLEKKLSIIRELITSGILKSAESVDSFVKSVS